MSDFLRIIPREHKAGQYCPTQGTKVLTPSGEELRGVTSIVLRAAVNDIWRAEISFTVDPPDVTCLADTELNFTSLSAQEISRLRELESERDEIIRRQSPKERTLVDFRAHYA